MSMTAHLGGSLALWAEYIAADLGKKVGSPEHRSLEALLDMAIRQILAHRLERLGEEDPARHVLHTMVGDDNWKTGKGDLDKLAAAFATADLDPVGARIATKNPDMTSHLDAKLKEIRATFEGITENQRKLDEAAKRAGVMPPNGLPYGVTPGSPLAKFIEENLVGLGEMGQLVYRYSNLLLDEVGNWQGFGIEPPVDVFLAEIERRKKLGPLTENIIATVMNDTITRAKRQSIANPEGVVFEEPPSPAKDEPVIAGGIDPERLSADEVAALRTLLRDFSWVRQRVAS